jgi:hypothetical protein
MRIWITGTVAMAHGLPASVTGSHTHCSAPVLSRVANSPEPLDCQLESSEGPLASRTRDRPPSRPRVSADPTNDSTMPRATSPATTNSDFRARPERMSNQSFRWTICSGRRAARESHGTIPAMRAGAIRVTHRNCFRSRPARTVAARVAAGHGLRAWGSVDPAADRFSHQIEFSVVDRDL